MGLRRAVAVFTAALVTAAPAYAADPVGPAGDPRSGVRSSERKIAELELRLSRLLSEMAAVEQQFDGASGRYGASYLEAQVAEARADEARRAFNFRARQAYKRGGGIPQASLLLGVETLPQLLSVARYLGSSMRADELAYQRLVEATHAVEGRREVLSTERRDLTEASARLEAIRAEIQTALGSEQQVLAGAKSELARLEAQRRARVAGSGTVSPGVEARRAARQVELDKKLAVVLAWYAPGYGPEPFMPPQFRPTGIVTTGLSSWYGPGFDGRRAASGCTYRMTQLTAASVVLPFGTFLKVSMGAKSVIVVITDRGPYVPGRVLDLSLAAAQAIGLTGVKQVRMEIVVPREPAPPYP